MSKYTVTAERTAKWWVLQAEEAPGAISQIARLDQADQIKEAIAFVTGEPEDEIEIELRPVLPAHAQEAHQLATQFRRDAARLNSESAYFARVAAHELAGAGLTVRDIGVVLGVSYQRAHQLVTADLDVPESLKRIPHDAHTLVEGGDIGEILAVVEIEPIEKHLTTADVEEEFRRHRMSHAD